MSEARLRDRIEHLEAENANLRHQLRLDHDVRVVAVARKAFNMPPASAKLLMQMLDGRVHSRDSLFHALYVDRLNPPEPKIIDVLIFRLRHALKEHGAALTTVRGTGYQISADGSAKVRAILGTDEAKP